MSGVCPVTGGRKNLLYCAYIIGIKVGSCRRGLRLGNARATLEHKVLDILSDSARSLVTDGPLRNAGREAFPPPFHARHGIFCVGY